MQIGRRSFTLGLGVVLGGCSRNPDSSQSQDEPVEPRVGPSASALPDVYEGEPVWAEGYSQAALDDAQAKYGLVFPPDLIALLRERRPAQSFDWRSDDAQIRELLASPLKGLLVAVEQNTLWWPEWGVRPATPQARSEILTRIVDDAPRLIPLFPSRFIPEEPNEAGNPIFSVYETVIYIGSDLDDYFRREFGDPTLPLPQGIKRIRFWSEMVERTEDA